MKPVVLKPRPKPRVKLEFEVKGEILAFIYLYDMSCYKNSARVHVSTLVIFKPFKFL